MPRHVAVVMDGNGRWAGKQGLPRTEGHRAGEAALVDVVAGAIEIGVEYLTVYAFSTENWKRSPAEVKFLMGYSRDVLRARRDLFSSWGVRVRWAGERGRLWPSVIRELTQAEIMTRKNTGMVLTLCVNYGARAEITAAARAMAAEAAMGRLDPARINERLLAAHLPVGELPDVDLFWRTSGEQRLSNYMLWQSAYAELVFSDALWPEVDRRDLWAAIEQYAARERRFGGAN
ncbi:MAG: di-trans,poly-cis-decaprenylcistransferase [Bifidobacteriaceae bacterium]|nr:di-trans,poly-cis-decaprenylcistransferase [Bifidobacteriaceae bacterium]